MKNLLKTLIYGVGSGTSFSQGLGELLDYNLKISSVRETVYNHTEKITPEIIEQADQLVSSIPQTEMYISFAFLSFAAVFGAYTIKYAFEKDKSKKTKI